jgi:hypothetical protein
VADWHRVNLGKMLVVAIDQLEELVTLATEEDRQLFISELCKSIDLANGSVRIIVTVRADFEPCFDQDPLLRQYWQDGRYQLPPLTAEDLRQVVEKPAEERAFYYESSTLVDELVNAVLPSPSSLSLLSFTLSELYRRYVDSGRMDRTVTWEDYKEIGGVAGALYTRAEQEYLALSAEEQKTMRRIMLQRPGTPACQTVGA